MKIIKNLSKKKVGEYMISVSILSKKDDYIDAINKLNDTNMTYLHLDIMDNTFTNNSSFSKEQAKQISTLNNKKLDIHLMSNDLDNILDYYIKLNPDIISIHYEINKDLDKYINKIKENNIKVGLAISPETKVNDIIDYLDIIDVVLVMSVIPGKGGQEFIKNTTNKLKELTKLKDKYNYLIEIDGGINDKTISDIKDYVDIIVSGSFIVNDKDYQKQIDKLK